MTANNSEQKEPFRKLEDITLTNEMIEELWQLQADQNSAIDSDIKQIDEVIDFLVSIHLYGKEAISKKRILDSIASLRWIIERHKVFKAPVSVVTK